MADASVNHFIWVHTYYAVCDTPTETGFVTINLVADLPTCRVCLAVVRDELAEGTNSEWRKKMWKEEPQSKKHKR